MENKDNKSIKNIEVGKFYYIYDGSPTGHPGYVVQKDDDNNRYLVVRTDSDKPGDVPKKDRGVRHITKLDHTIGEGIATSYIKNRPTLCKRKDIGIPLTDLSLDPEDYEKIQTVSKRKPNYSPSLQKSMKKRH